MKLEKTKILCFAAFVLSCCIFPFPLFAVDAFGSGTDAGFQEAFFLTSNPLFGNYLNYSSYDSFRKIKYTTDFLEEQQDPKAIQMERERIQTRRSMLTWHQGLGMLTWTFWLAANLSGENALRHLKREYEPFANYLLLSNPNQNALAYSLLIHASPWDSETPGSIHKSLAYTAFGLYLTTATMAIFAPTRPLEREPGLTTIFTHRAMILIHLPAMLSLPFIGMDIAKEGPSAAHRMQAVGWAGWGALSVAIAVFYF
ncbi:hypothetical protein CH373_15290 [Leptospira perolatii]|uniref:Uncharacterized protein n=1 Tax=Leptospira perolatii TaxID=2023191 RepID=A0A2M9ZK12_9LEPT|nr:hypothetical protein [Leptospira perolatii]PJZ69458.1 hypothetical protein CH360_10630 [Leptospira perolatii]PJZ72283.1 hypothetical protein CH373_15290 [Leptospira perolatii]